MIPFLDLKAQYQTIRGELDAAVLRVLESSQFILGDEVAAFESEFAAYCGVRHAVGLNSGTSALHLALLAAGVGPGDEVITTPMTFVATVAAIVYAGATPVFVDIDPLTGTIDPDRIDEAITTRTKAILPVHLHGLMADMDPILSLADAHGLVVIEDAAQAHGAEYKGRRAGSMGDMGCFSFYPGKNLGACGEGGAVVTNDARLAETIRMLRDWGQASKYDHVMKGYNYRMEGIQGAVLGVKLRHIEAWTEARRRHADRYDALLSGSGIGMPASMSGLEARLPCLRGPLAQSGHGATAARPGGRRHRHSLSGPGASATGLCRSRSWTGRLSPCRALRSRDPLTADVSGIGR